MKISFQLKDQYIWLSKEICLVLVSFQDRRCHQTPDRTHVCFWEGDFNCVFDVMKIIPPIQTQSEPQAQLIGRVKLNDHDYKRNNWNRMVVPSQPNYLLSLAGGPSYASGYQIRNNLRFEISFLVENLIGERPRPFVCGTSKIKKI